jgi:TorA maturation chaperone TorD
MIADTTVAWLAFAGRAFLEPDIETLRQSLKQLRALDQDHGPSTAALERALEESGDPFGIEYVRLFLDPAGAPCPPWQSAWGPDGRLMGTPHLGALDWYRRFGFAPSLENEPADHIGLLLLFASYLISHMEENALASFAEEHLDWIPRFCESLSANARLDFYRLVADHTARLCAELEPEGRPRNTK